MNKARYKVIFNRHRGQMMAVAENTVSNGKSPADRSAGEHSVFKQFLASIPVLTSAILLGLGICVVLDQAIAADIHVDPSAPKNQRPNIVQSANGTVQVNIQTPSKKGVSLNQYRQFDVHQKGAILNNSRKNTRTHLGGWVQGNPWLAGGEAKIIVNQINSRNPSQLNGYIEVAGRRAEVIMANPSGINVNGGGFINAAGVTLTTGQPIINNGQLNGYQVREGNISINGQGLDSSGSDYTRLLSKAAQINAGIWANDLSIIAGSNDLSSDGQISQIQSDPNGRERIAIDTAQLGGMYAGKISLISSEKGVGVNNAGQIFAGAGGVVISADGKLSNSGSIVAADRAQNGGDQAGAALQGQSIINSGTVSSQGKMQLQSEQLKNSGLITSADELNIRNQHNLDNQGEINAGRLDIDTNKLHNREGKIIQTGLQSLGINTQHLENSNNSLIGYAPSTATADQPDSSSTPTKPTETPSTPPTTASAAGTTQSVAETNSSVPRTFTTGQITSESINNDNGQIIANGGIDLSSEQGLTNQATLNLNQLHVSGAELNNQHGKLSVNQAHITTDRIDNRQGEIFSNKHFKFAGQHLDNRQGKIQSANQLQIHSQEIDNSATGVIAAQNQAELNTTSLNNNEGSIDAENINLSAERVSNQQGAIRANKQLQAQINQSLDNQQGQISSAEDLLLHDQQQENLIINNSGKILAGNDLTIQSKQLHNSGEIGANRDASIQLRDDFNITADLNAGGALNISSKGDISNHQTLTGGKSVKLNGNNIINHSDGTIQSNTQTELQANHSITNRGLINSNGTTLIQSASDINNIGTGRIYGNHVAIGTQQLINREETLNNHTQAAVIAARQRLDIGAKDITNQEHALISSAGDIAIGGALDQKNQAIGMADRLINSSARIEAQGNGTIAVQQLQNRNNHFNVEEYLHSEERIKQYQQQGNPAIWVDGVDGKFVRERKKLKFIFNDGSEKIWKKWHSEKLHWWDFKRKTYKQKVTETDPSEIIIGGDLNISGSHWLNENSHIIVGGILSGTTNLNLENRETKGQQRVEEQGRQGGYKYDNPSHRKGRIKTTNTKSYNRTISTSHDFDNPVSTVQQHANTGTNQAQADQANLNNLPDHQLNQHNQLIQSQNSSLSKLPNSSLYHINPNNNGYLIETDPAYTNMHKWLSSDYMLSALGHDPSKMQKRLGDGYYEQRLINEQITNLTGYRRLENYQNDEEQYKALMNAGVTFAQQYNITPGIALTAEQMAKLTSDIIWLVSETITLADGSKQNVLVPKVYLIARSGDVSANGSLISARNINLQNSGDISNQGTIAAQNIVNLGAQNIDNSGLISAQKMSLSAQHNIDFNGGAAVAKDLMLLNADHVQLKTTTVDYGDQRNGGTVIDRTAGLYLTGEKDSVLSISGTHGISTHGAAIINNAENGLTQLSAKEGSVELSTVTTSQNMASGSRSDKNHWINRYQSENGTGIIAAGDININAKDQINLRQSDIYSLNGSINIYGENGVNIIEGRQQTELDHSVYRKTKKIASKKTVLDRHQANYNEAIGSTLSGRQVNIGSAQDIHIQGSNIISTDQTILSAGRDINIEAAHNLYQDHIYHEEKKSGFSASVTKGVASVGYSKSKLQLDQQDHNNTLTMSQIASLNGNTILQADGDINLKASALGAGKNLTLNAQNINLMADHISSDHHTDLKTKQSGFSIGFTYSPLVAAATTLKDGMRSGDFSNSIVGRSMQLGEAASSAYQAASTPIVVTLSHQRSHQTRDVHQRTAVGSELTAGGNLNLIAKGGDITSEGGKLSAEGDAILYAKDNINLSFARDAHSESASSKTSGFNFDNRNWNSSFGMYHDKSAGQGKLDTITGTQLSVGGASIIKTDTGDINILGSSVVATHNNIINAAGDVNIKSSQNSSFQSEKHSSKGWGSAQISDTEKFTGYMSSKDEYRGNSVEQIRSQIGSLTGNVNIQAGGHYTQQVADIIAGKDINISAKDINILDDANYGSSHQSSKDLKIGNFTKISSPLIDLANAVDTAYKSKADDRTRALQGMAALGQGYMVYSAAQNFQNALNNNAGVIAAAMKNGQAVDPNKLQDGTLLKIETGIGFKSSNSRQDNSYRVSQANQLTAGGNINLNSREGDIHLQNTQLSATDTIALNSVRDILLEAGQNRQQADGKNSSAGVSVGVGASIGAKTGVYIYGDIGFSSGKNHLDALTYNPTTLQSDKLKISSKGNTTLKGAQATANRIDADVGGKLSIISLQDKIDQKNSQSGANIHVQGGFGSVWEVSGGVNSSKASGHLNAVNQQSGLFAGEGGYHIKADSVELQGGAIASSAAKEHNQLIANSISFSDIENQSSFKANTASINGGVSGLGSSEPGKPHYTPSIPQHQSGSDKSTTHATLSPGQIIINGKETSVEELGIHSDINTAHSQVNQLPDLQQILDKQQAVADATATIMQSVRTFSSDMANKAAKERLEAREQAEQEMYNNNPELWQEYNELTESEKQLVLRETNKEYQAADDQAQSWGIGGNKSRALNAVTTAITGILGGQTNMQVLTNTLAPYASELIGRKFGHGEDQNKAAQLLAHAILGAVTASVNGGNAAAGAAGATGAELAADYLISQLPKDKYPEAINPLTGEIDPNRLPEEVKSTIRDLSSAVASVAGGITGGNISNAQIAGVAGMNAVENNALINIKGESKLNSEERKINEKLKKAGVQIADDYQKRYDACVTDQCRQQVEKDYRKASEEANKIILNLYMTGQLTEEESKILLTSYATKMMQGAGESQRARGPRIVDINVNEWIPSARIANEYFHQITIANVIKQMKRSGKSDEQIETRLVQYGLVANHLGSYSVLQQQVDALINKGEGGDALIQAAIFKNKRKLINGGYNAKKGTSQTNKVATTGTPNLPVARKGKVTYEPLAKPDANELRAGQKFADQGYDVTYRATASDKGISGTRTSDLHVKGIGKVDVYTPKPTTKVDRILSSIEKKSNQAGGVIVQMDLSGKEMQSMASRLWGKPNAQNIKTLFFQDSKGTIHRYDRK